MAYRGSPSSESVEIESYAACKRSVQHLPWLSRGAGAQGDAFNFARDDPHFCRDVGYTAARERGNSPHRAVGRCLRLNLRLAKPLEVGALLRCAAALERKFKSVGRFRRANHFRIQNATSLDEFGEIW